MKRLTIIAAVGMLAASSLAFAGGWGWWGKHRHDDHGHHGERGAAAIAWRLDLSEAQQDPVRDILLEQRKKRRALRQSLREQAQPQFDALQAETREQLASVLNAEQLEEYDEMVEEKHSRRKGRRGHHH